VRRIQRHKILVVGSFIMGLDTDEPGIGERIAATAAHYGVDILNTLFLTPLPGTRLWDDLESQGRIATDGFPEDWRYYTLTFPVARYQRFTRADLAHEMDACDGTFYSLRNILRRAWKSLWRRRRPLISIVANLSYRKNLRQSKRSCRDFLATRSHGAPDNRHPGLRTELSRVLENARGASPPRSVDT
jgi:radical SAM superfamily enzyme YgiQ (UPF0313 family)